ncbi:hypothetical protein CDL12_08379 [Handroanthus impetiginosus]|uniref:CG-1 domain-containing protein n=1 Tax=Handroanthus impetiginosus TaxID=429701 RepID=A0A2G9HN23_9LAMI|nr:hypothetical protein CDL12_08379 [Handroanthus impetiginosus]
MTMIPGKENELQARVFTDVSSKRQEFGSNSYTLVNSQASDHDSLNKSNFSMDQMSDENLNLGQNMYFLPPNQPQSYGLVTNLDVVNGAELWETVGLCNPSLSKQNTHPTQNDLLVQALNSVRSSSKSETDVKLYAEDKTDYPALKSRLLGDVLQEGRKMVDSFGCWISEEQGDVQPMEPSSGTFCEIVRSENGDDFGISTQVTLGCHILGPSLSQDQLFSIIEISPKWGYSGSEIKVHVIGRFLGSQEEVKKYKWTCMFGELEVPAEIVVDGVLRCHTPLHETGRVPFYITCSNRLACSEVREFEFRSSSAASRFQSYGGMMAESRHYALNAQLDIDQILLEAQHRWLRPAEICEILQNYKKFCISSEPPTRPASGSLFLFDRKVLRYFRKDGHNWRKKKDGKTVKEAHERLKAGSVDVLHCYYAHGEDNENFQRRSYWMLEEELSHIVLVHYREVKGNRTNFNRIRDANGIPDSRQTEEDISTSEVDSSAASRFQSYDYQRASQVTDTTSLNSTQASEREDSQLAYRHQASPGFQSIHELPSPAEIGSVPYYPVPISDNYQGHFAVIPGMSFGSLTQEKKIKNPTDDSLTYELHQDLEFSDCENVVESSNAGYQSVNFQPSLPSTQLSAMSTLPGEGNELVDEVFTGFRKRQEIGAHSDGVEDFQASDCDSLNKSKWPVDQKSDDNMDLRLNAYYPPLSQPQLYDLPTKLDDVNQVNQVELFETAGLHNPYLTEQSRHPTQNDIKLQALNSVGSTSKSESNVKLNVEDKTNHPALKQPLLGGVLREGLKKLDSFDRWMSKELGDVESTTQPTTGAYWETVGSDDGDDSGISPQVTLDNYILGPSLSQDQLFSIVDFTPNWAYSGSAVKMLVMGKFLRIQEEVEKCKWACMFGELEVPAEIVADGVLQCHTPLHEMGRVSFYITCSNRLACSEVREFEFRSSSVQDVDIGDVGSITSYETLLHMRFGKLLSLGSNTPPASVQCSSAETSKLCGKICALL